VRFLIWIQAQHRVLIRVLPLATIRAALQALSQVPLLVHQVFFLVSNQDLIRVVYRAMSLVSNSAPFLVPFQVLIRLRSQVFWYSWNPALFQVVHLILNRLQFVCKSCAKFNSKSHVKSYTECFSQLYSLSSSEWCTKFNFPKCCS
jgi:hypothetical protein